MYRRTVEQVAQVVGGTLVRGDSGAPVKGVSTDSRTVADGQLFIPLVGERFDGHSFVAEAVARGAAAVLFAKSRFEPAESGATGGATAFVSVPDTLHALHALAAEARGAFPFLEDRVVAVTGSVGKTTTKDMLAAILALRWRTTKSKGNFNNEIGLPLTLLTADDGSEAFVLEMGMRGLGEIRALARIARPFVAIVTNVSAVHLERLGTVERIAAAKGELVDELPEDGWAVLNGDDPLVREMAAGRQHRTLTYGTGPHNDVRAEHISLHGAEGVRFTLVWKNERHGVHIPVAGGHNVRNALAAAAAAFALGIEAGLIADGLTNFARDRSDMRMQFVQGPDGLQIVNDAYNAAPASMEAALDVLRELDGRKVAVLGDMLELGPMTTSAHYALGERTAQAGVQLLIAVGEQAETVATGAREAGMDDARIFTCPDAAAAARLAEKLVQPDDVVLVKASRGIGLEAVVEQLANWAGGPHEEGAAP